MKREEEIGFVLRRLNNLIKRDVEISKQRLNLDFSSDINGWVIGYLYENRDKDIFQKDFEAQLSVRRSTASNILKSMEQRGLIERLNVASDARLKKIALTPKAIEIHEKIIAEINAREQRMRAGISKEDLTTFLEVVKKISANMEDRNDKNFS